MVELGADPEFPGTKFQFLMCHIKFIVLPNPGVEKTFLGNLGKSIESKEIPQNHMSSISKQKAIFIGAASRQQRHGPIIHKH